MGDPAAPNSLLISYLTLRRLIGFLGIGLPFLILLYLLITASVLEYSISTYYHTNMRDILVGILCATGVFMIAYKGYDRQDMIASNFAGACAILVAMFPTDKFAVA